MTLEDQHKRDGDSAGRVLELAMPGDGIINAFYTVNLMIGDGGQTYPMLVDTGSSDLWVASTSCPSCNGAPKQYDPSHSSTSQSTGQNFQYPYLSGSVSGPIYWDQATLGSYIIPHQALCAANAVSDESLNVGYSGIIGLALPSLSLIQQLLPAGSGDEDGTPFTSSLFGLPSAPQNQFFTISLSRPGFEDPSQSANSWPARLGIGAHVDEVVHAFSSDNFDNFIQWVNLVTSATDGYTHWKARLAGLTVYTDGAPNQVTLPEASDGGGHPVVVLDTGGPNWMGSKSFCDAVYGAWGISMNHDGNYYVPCTQPLNMTVTFGSLPPIPIHPIDMSNFVDNNPSNGPNCLGTLQASSALGTPSAPADVALGVSFLRNVYVVYSMSGSNSSNSTSSGNAVPQFGYVPLTNITLALQEFHNMRVLNVGPGGGSNRPGIDDTATKASMGVLGKIMTGLGVLIAVCLLLFGARWWVLSRRFKRRLANGSTTSEEGLAMREWVDNLKRKGTRRFNQITEFGTPDGIVGDVATRSAYGHGTEEGGSRFTHLNGPTERPSNIRQGTGPFAGFSWLTFIGARRLGFGGGYERAANPALGGEGDGLHRDNLPTEDEIRQQKFLEYKRQKSEGIQARQRGNEMSVYSDVTFIDRGDGTFLLPGTPGIPVTPNDTIVGSTTYLNPYGFPKGVDEFGGRIKSLSDDGSSERGGSTLHGSPELPPKPYHSSSLDQRLNALGVGSSRNASRTSLPLNAKGSSGSLASGFTQHIVHRSVPSLDLDRPAVTREESTQLFTYSPNTISPESNPTTPTLPAGAATSTSTPHSSIEHSTSFNPYVLPLSIPAQPAITPVHPVRERIALAIEPSLSPLTEVTSQEFPSTRSDPSIRQGNDIRRSLLGSLRPLAPVSSQGGSERQSMEESLRESLERQSSISGMSMESEVLVPLPITLMAANSSYTSSLPTTAPRSSVIRISDDPPPPIRPFNVNLSDSPSASVDSIPPPPPPKTETPRTNSVPINLPPVHAHSPLRPVIQPPTAQIQPRSTPPPNRSRNPFDLLGFDALDAKDSRFPSFALGESRIPSFTPPSTNSTPLARPVNIRSSSASPSRPAPVPVPDTIVRPRPRHTDPTLPRPQSAMQSSIPSGGLGIGSFIGRSGEGTRGRSSSSGNVDMQPMDRAHPRELSRELVQDPLRDFLPPHRHRPQEHHTLPATSSTRPVDPPHLTSEPAVASMGPRHRGPRPMAHGPRASSRESRSNSTSAPSSTSPPTRQGTTFDSPISFSSPASVSPTGAVSGPRPRGGPHSHSSSGSNSSLPPGAMAPHRPGVDAPRLIPSPPHSDPPPASLVTRSTPLLVRPSTQQPPPSPSTPTVEGPDAAYGGMVDES